MKIIIIGIFFLILGMAAGCGRKNTVYREDFFETMTESETETEREDFSTEEETYYVYVCGEVNAPGVYQLPKGSRVYEAIEMAGGLTEQADNSAINQALFLEDGQMIQVYAQGEVPMAVTAGEQADGKINLNTADMARLMEIPGIGEAKAKSIIAYREEHGSFQSSEDVMNIPGIKEGLYSKMKDYITVN